MSQSEGSKLSVEDYQRIEANQLGIPLGVYRLKPGYIRLIHRGGLFTFIIGVVFLGAVFIIGIRKDLEFSVLLSPLLASLYLLIMGGFILRIRVPQVQSMRVIVCEQGLLQIERKIGKNCVGAVHWQDILAVRKLPTSQEYAITRRGGKALTFTNFYQDIDELVALIRLRSGKEGENP
jgi:hypothetical protein